MKETKYGEKMNLGRDKGESFEDYKLRRQQLKEEAKATKAGERVWMSGGCAIRGRTYVKEKYGNLPTNKVE